MVQEIKTILSDEASAELTILNTIWTQWNKNGNIVETHRALGKVDWKYHMEGVDALYDAINPRRY